MERTLITGLHTVRDAFCVKCDSKLGWRYESAVDEGQRSGAIVGPAYW